jgi:hypothetical protein
LTQATQLPCSSAVCASAVPLKAMMSAPYFSAIGLLYQAPWMPQTFLSLRSDQSLIPTDFGVRMATPEA